MIHILSEQNSILSKFVSELRDKSIQGDPLRFRRNMERIGEIMAYEISKTMDFSVKGVQTPLGEAQVALLEEGDVVLATILRAGVPFHNGFLNYFDRASNAFVSAYRKHTHEGDKHSFEIDVEYVSSCDLTGKTLILADPMLATGASFVLVHNALIERCGTPKITHVAAIIASQAGVDYVNENMPTPNFEIWCAAVDAELSTKSYIVPGLGDAGDLAYGSKL
ncbi:MAG: uracil phosphoribosyltransferase [Rikenellaceae bacterium]